MNLKSVKDTYRRYAKFYDVIFGAVLDAGRKAAIRTMKYGKGDRILEVGVGTGISLPMYPRDVKLVGIDISAEMLDVAHKRVSDQSLHNVESLRVMDAEQMDFPDQSFDKVIAMYVASVVPHPDRLINEMRRVCKPNGEIVIVNHFRSSHRVINGAEALLRPFANWIGFQPDVELDQFIADNNLDVLDIRDTDFLGHWKLIRCRNNLNPQATVPPAQESVKLKTSEQTA
ncbi:MAG: methyltransferase domain-containing protein [Myxococcales bacterium]|nr:methyltransferase domain-containing protein [Myxococcales bacterium]